MIRESFCASARGAVPEVTPGFPGTAGGGAMNSLVTLAE